MSVLALATIGGLISFLATSAGALLSLFSHRKSKETRWNLSVDFALGLMVSASAFSLIGPAAFGAKTSGHSVGSIFLIAFLGAAFIYVVKSQIEVLKTDSALKTSHVILASVLMLHNFPEGLASGSALAGLDLQAALPILGGISIQNIPEGLLMVLCLLTFGWSKRAAILGGVGSGVVELGGGVLAGLLMESVNGILPALLSFAGGSMMASVMIEIFEGERPVAQTLKSRQFALGILSIPLLQFVIF